MWILQAILQMTSLEANLWMSYQRWTDGLKKLPSYSKIQLPGQWCQKQTWQITSQNYGSLPSAEYGSTNPIHYPDSWNHHTWQELLDATAREIQVNPTSDSFPDSDD